MTGRPLAPTLGLAAICAASFAASLSLGAGPAGPAEAARALVAYDPERYADALVVLQRLPRALIAVYVGAAMAVAGALMQGLTRNPLAAPATLGVNAGAALFLVAGIVLFDLGLAAQGMAALLGALAGFAACLGVARIAGAGVERRGMLLVVAGALVSMLMVALANAMLLADPARRMDLLAFIVGNINHAYVDRLARFWWIGAGALAALMVLHRPLTLITLGADKAASAGVAVAWTGRAGLALAALAAGSAVAVAGPIGFLGLVVPHMVRPFVGSAFGALLPAAALAGAAAALLADIVAHQAFLPFVVHTGVVMDLLGGAAFVVIVRRAYRRRLAGARA
ncbi:iron ABC transporter permease [Acuticoccus sp. I52.16.1]|uniref:FecCD family ABC transporter permease n=1 Tax=Acuticoccus sp. I52.16.1 TaxID=2928472 RepID=UPI001FD11550|nr:iron chelate uptake ABC transporter family permease subunit [Acuticoccus sp. I52.16.1]UOM32679.1 iron ABC transporter permease [Acuticoccus sp. I52.16.1]